MKLRILAATVATGVITTAAWPLVSGADAAERGAENITVVQHNTDQNRNAMREAVKKAKSTNAQGITLQEICANWLPELQKNRGWTIASKASKPIDPGHHTGGCGDGVDVLDVAIWTGGKGGGKAALPLTKDGGFVREGETNPIPVRTPHLVCVSFGKKPVKHVCSTHLVAFENPAAPVRATQAAEVAQYAAKWTGKGHSVVVGGDLNTQPKNSALNSMYANGPSSSGHFVEAEQLRTSSAARGGRITTDVKVNKKTGKKTNRGKIDYLFFSDNHTRLNSGGKTSIVRTKSGHHMLVTTARIA